MPFYIYGLPFCFPGSQTPLIGDFNSKATKIKDLLCQPNIRCLLDFFVTLYVRKPSVDRAQYLPQCWNYDVAHKWQMFRWAYSQRITFFTFRAVIWNLNSAMTSYHCRNRVILMLCVADFFFFITAGGNTVRLSAADTWHRTDVDTTSLPCTDVDTTLLRRNVSTGPLLHYRLKIYETQ